MTEDTAAPTPTPYIWCSGFPLPHSWAGGGRKRTRKGNCHRRTGRPAPASECVFFSGDAARRAKVSSDGLQEPPQAPGLGRRCSKRGVAAGRWLQSCRPESLHRSVFMSLFGFTVSPQTQTSCKMDGVKIRSCVFKASCLSSLGVSVLPSF